MNPESIAELLEPLREPGAISWWPLAPGWWILLALLCIAVAICAYLLRRRYQRRAPLREASQRLISLRDDEGLSSADKAARLGQLQRQLAIAVSGRSNSAPLTGAAWADYLNALGHSNQRLFTAEMADLAYRPVVEEHDCLAAMEATNVWLRDLRPPQ